MPTSTQVGNFENQISSLADYVLAMRAQIEQISVYTWSGANGAGFEQVYQASTPPAPPAGGAIDKNQMNNVIAALNSVEAAITAASAALAVVAQFKPQA